MNKFHFTTVVSNDYLFKFSAMYTSLAAHCQDFHLFILCANAEAHAILAHMAWKNVTLVSLSEIEDLELLQAKSNRSFHEYCWTLKPVFLHYILKKHPEAYYFAHLDGDFLFFSNPEQIFAENPTASLFLTDHNNSERFMHYYDLTGKYNTGFVGCRNDAIALAAIERWRNQCIEYCKAEMDTVRKSCGDQRYVEDWPDKYKKVHTVNSIGANTAMWNIEQYKVSNREGQIYLNEEKLIFYHFSGLSIISPKEFNLNWYYPIDDVTVQLIYLPYIYLLSGFMQHYQMIFPWFKAGISGSMHAPNMHYYRLN